MPAGPFVPYEIRSHAGGAAPAKLNTTMAVDALSFTLQAGQGASYPDGTNGPFHISLDFSAVGMEHVRVSTRSGDTFNLNSLADRGLMGTTPLQHAQGAAVSHGWSALESDEVIATAHNTLGRIANKGDMLYADTGTTLAAFAKGTAGQSPVYQADSSVAAGNPVPAAHTHPFADITGGEPILSGFLATSLGITTTPATFLTTASLATGTWLINATLVGTLAAGATLVLGSVAQGTATATFSGATATVMVGTGATVPATMTFVAVVTVAGTVLLQAATSASTATILGADQTFGHVTGYTALKVA